MRAGVLQRGLDGAAVTGALALCLGCLHVIALKSQLLTGLGGSSDSAEAPVSYETFYFDQKVSVTFTLMVSFDSFVLCWSFILFCYFLIYFFVSLHFTLTCFGLRHIMAEFTVAEKTSLN